MRDAEVRSVPVSTGPARSRSTRSRVRSHPELQGSHTRRMRDTYVQYLCHGVGKSKSKHQQLYERISGVIGVQVEHHLAFFVHVSSKYECERGPGAVTVSIHSRGILQL